MSKNILLSVFVTMFAFLSANYAEGGGSQASPDLHTLNSSAASKIDASAITASNNQSVADKYFSPTIGIPKEPMLSSDPKGQFCDSDNTGVITVYSTNGSAQNEIDVKLDGRSIGSLQTYYPTGEPSCKSPNAKGIITISVPAGKHILNATSTNLRWPNHSFSVPKCGCMVLPLS